MIFGGSVIVLASIIGAAYISGKAGLDMVLYLADNGYKIDIKAIEEAQKKYYEERSKKSNKLRRLVGIFILIMPGVNMLTSWLKCRNAKEAILNDESIQSSLVPMTEEENEQYASLDTRWKKLAFASYNMTKNKDEEFFGFFGNKLFTVDHGLSSLHYDKLLPLDYTLDEVKRLNDVTKYSYRLGKMDGKNVAIIGIPNPDSKVLRLQFKDEDYRITHDYEPMSDEEAENLTFTVYPFIMPQYTDEIDGVIEDIKQSRINAATKANMEALQTTIYDAVQTYHEAPGVEISYAVSEDDEITEEDMAKVMDEDIFDHQPPKPKGYTLNPNGK